jgi:hypothetical protein
MLNIRSVLMVSSTKDKLVIVKINVSWEIGSDKLKRPTIQWRYKGQGVRLKGTISIFFRKEGLAIVLKTDDGPEKPIPSIEALKDEVKKYGWIVPPHIEEIFTEAGKICGTHCPDIKAAAKVIDGLIKNWERLARDNNSNYR